MDTQCIKAEMLVVGSHRSSMDQLTAWTEAVDQTLVF
jgi:hypothetical protein